VHAAHQLRASGQFPDGQLYANLQGAQAHPLQPAEVLGRFLRVLGMEGSSVPDSLEERAEHYRTLLADRRVLVVLDNAAGEAQVRPLLPGSPSCGVLITSRARLVWDPPSWSHCDNSALGQTLRLVLLCCTTGTLGLVGCRGWDGSSRSWALSLRRIWWDSGQGDAGGCSISALGGDDMATEPSGILVPAYDRPNPLSDWDPLFAVAPYLWPRRLIVIANDNNGPGYTFKFDDDGIPVEILGHSAPLEIYVAAIDAVTRRCGMVVGYVHDCYHDHYPEGRPPSGCPRPTEDEDGPAPALPGKPTIREDIARWFAAYPKVGGIFIDQVDRDDMNRAVNLKKMVDDEYRKKWINFPERRAVTVLNPGSIPSIDFMTQTDPAIVVIQEQSYDHFRTNWPPPGWVRDRDGGDLSVIPARRLAIIAHTPQNAAADVAMLVDVARRYSIGSVYANDLVGSNYNTLSPHLVPLGQRICQLHTKFGLPCRIIHVPLCAGSQVLTRVRSGLANAFARR
jgi:Spherulation-specific family 4